MTSIILSNGVDTQQARELTGTKGISKRVRLLRPRKKLLEHRYDIFLRVPLSIRRDTSRFLSPMSRQSYFHRAASLSHRPFLSPSPSAIRTWPLPLPLSPSKLVAATVKLYYNEIRQQIKLIDGQSSLGVWRSHENAPLRKPQRCPRNAIAIMFITILSRCREIKGAVYIKGLR